MRNILTVTVMSLFTSSHAFAIPVEDITTNLNTSAMKDHTGDIMNTNREIKETTKETLKAVTGERTEDAQQVGNLGAANGLSAVDAPCDAADIADKAAEAISEMFKGDVTTTAKVDDKNPNSVAFETIAKGTVDINGAIKAVRAALKVRKASFDMAATNIGKTTDVKASIDQNSQIQVQNGLVMNELIGAVNSTSSSLQNNNQRIVNDMYNTRQVMMYSE